ncbi:MAG: phosphate acyltransferase PlsX [Coriobacteriia bacterium]|nr:MAG: phosphate acyltransferase PlsX [Coriobacteriia bacterium]
MSMDEIKVVVDAQGGDNAPGVVLEGVAQAVAQDPSITVILTGAEDVIVPFAAEHANVVAHPTTEVIEMGEHPAEAVRRKKDSSIVVGCRLVKEGEAGGFFSAGSTGACMSAATLVIGRIKGVKRPAIATVLPSPVAKVVFTDMGANADCKPEYLVQFARMARVYAQVALGVENPSVGLLNIGEEETKGSEFAQECHKLMKEHVPNFKGNAEGGNLALGGFDVIVTDGFTGNVALKVYEGVGKALLVGLKETIYSTTKSKIGGLLIKDALSAFKEDLSADKYGGAQLLGCKGVCLIGHGSSNAKAICSGVLATADAIRQDMPKRLAQALAGDGVTEEVL